MTATSSYTHEIEPCLARIGTTPEDKPMFIKEIYAIDDVNLLRQLVIKKERERQSIANDLEVAARIGLVISETNEAIQVKLEQLERDNKLYQEELLSTTTARQYSSRISRNNVNSGSEFDEDERIQLIQELDQAKKELSKFRKEMDGLSAQLNDMAVEMIDSRSKVTMYAKRLAEVEQKLAATREVNTNLQSLLDKALTSQKQSSSNTSHLVKNIQSDLSRVISENEQLRARIAELENQQVECEEKLAAMVMQAQEYAQRLEQAQDTIHSLSEPKILQDDEEDFYHHHHPHNTNPVATRTFSFSSTTSSTTASTTTNSENVVTAIGSATKGPLFSAEFRNEMRKEIERNLSLRNEIRHRIITADTSILSSATGSDIEVNSSGSIKQKPSKNREGLKELLHTNSETMVAVATKKSLSTSTTASATTISSSSSILSNVKLNKDFNHAHESNSNEQQPPPAPILRPASFLTGFNGFGSTISATPKAHFITRGLMPASTGNTTATTTVYSNQNKNNGPSISTRFFQRLASRLDDYEKKNKST
ncbi:hypothetical protein BDF20DRAFT_871546 [Mycotypha africana]|uniref:uncharacterized protein n=1 Tax=Mycotypha africana TaxID=64632 RepID=UPI0023010EB3|nr:uncharacterized protein BDF20DRAFT_871546 [Mycotypha africana]KAI8979765.1 hypothetical protein BDF20DRAFT_871546 [Mycotypha africana]